MNPPRSRLRKNNSTKTLAIASVFAFCVDFDLVLCYNLPCSKDFLKRGFSMLKKINKRVRAISYLLMLVYFASYIMRINFAVMIVKVCSDMQLQKSALAIVLTGLTVAYGAGQVLSGVVGDKIKPRTMIICGLALASACNIAMFFSSSVALMTVIWTVNGIGHSMLWPPIVRLLSSTLDDEEYSYAVVRVSWGSSVATILLYSLCPLLLRFMSWREIIASCAAVGAAVLITWIAFSKRLFSSDTSDNREKAEMGEAVKTLPVPKYVLIPMVLIMLGIILQGMLRDGVTNWVPSLLNESFGIPEEDAIFAAVIPAIFSMVSFYAFDLLHRRVFHNEVLCAAVIFGGSLCFAIAMYAVNSFLSSAVLSVVIVAIIIACMHGINLMLISIVPKRFAKSGKVATFSGLVNSCTYIGAAIATPVFAKIAEISGWGVTILSWAVISLLGLLVCFFASPLWKRFRKEYSDN